MTEHTKLPWHHSRKSVYVSDINHTCIAQMIRGQDENEANAAFIVKAVNNHADLVKARATFLGYLQAENGCKRTGAACREKCGCDLELLSLVEAFSAVVSSPGDGK